MLTRLKNFCSFFALASVHAAVSANACDLKAVVGLYKPPYIYEADSSGLELEIFAAALSAVKCTVRWTHTPPARALAMLRQKETDAMLTVRDTAKVAAFFSAPYIIYHNVAISLSARNVSLEKIEDLAAYQVLAFQNAGIALGERYRKTVATAPQYIEVAQQITQIRMLFSERTEVIVGDRLTLEYLRDEVATERNSNIRIKAPITVHEIFEPTEYQAAFIDSGMRDRFNQGLAQIKANGTYAKIVARYRAAGRPHGANNWREQKTQLGLSTPPLR